MWEYGDGADLHQVMHYKSNMSWEAEGDTARWNGYDVVGAYKEMCNHVPLSSAELQEQEEEDQPVVSKSKISNVSVFDFHPLVSVLMLQTADAWAV